MKVDSHYSQALAAENMLKKAIAMKVLVEAAENKMQKAIAMKVLIEAAEDKVQKTLEIRQLVEASEKKDAEIICEGGGCDCCTGRRGDC